MRFQKSRLGLGTFKLWSHLDFLLKVSVSERQCFVSSQSRRFWPRLQLWYRADNLYTFLPENEAHFCLQFKKKSRTMPASEKKNKKKASLRKKTKFQIFNLKKKKKKTTSICNLSNEQKQQQVPHNIISKMHFASCLFMYNCNFHASCTNTNKSLV